MPPTTGHGVAAPSRHGGLGLSSFATLPDLLAASARRRPDHVAVVEPGAGEITYRDLHALALATRDHLAALGVGRGDRVGVHLPKSIDAVAAQFGIMLAGAAYVPVDPHAPAARAAYILHDCGVKAILVDRPRAAALRGELEALGPLPPVVPLEPPGGGAGLGAAVSATPGMPSGGGEDPPAPGDLAYVLYTSGSTGKPKGVMLSHLNAISFVDWCTAAFAPVETDRFSSHAPFHFDLSILDLYVPIKHGATLVLVDAEVGKDPLGLADLIAEAGITVWYSAPSILSMLAQFGKLERYGYEQLRTVLFAGEVFPVKHLRLLKRLLPHPRYFNLYGPTETNVCTWYEIPAAIPEDRTAPYPIGTVCAQLRGVVVDEAGADVARGGEGELCIAGPNVMCGYWNLPAQTARAFLEGRSGGPWYRTGDIVVEGDDGNLHFVGRRDRMVKRRGYRIELAEIEAGLYRHPAVKEAAVIALKDDEGVRIRAFLGVTGERRPSLIDLKRFCAETLPIYMVPDDLLVRDALPKTSTDKIDYQRLAREGA